MRIRFRTPEATGLKVIEEIPDHKLCHLEGRNGIGKTLAIRLLELISGRQPYSTLPHAWRSLKEQLGRTTVTFTGLAEGELSVVLTPDQWPNEPLPQIDSLGYATLNGERVLIEKVRQLIHVYRIAGDETLTETLALELAERAAQARQTDNVIQPTFTAWDTELEDMAQLVRSISVSELRRRQDAEATSSARSNDLEADARATNRRLAETTAARTSTGRMRRRREELDALLTELDRAATKLASRERKIEQLTAKLSQLSAERNLDAIESELQHWSRLFHYRTTAHSKALVAERQVLRILELDERPDETTRHRMEQEAREAAARHREELRRLDRVGGLKDLLNDLDTTLTAAPGAVAYELVVREPAALTTEALREGVQSRRQELAGVPRPGDVEALDDAVLAAIARAIRLSRLAELIRTSDRKARLLNEASSKIDELWAHVEGTADLQSLSAELRTEADGRLGEALAVVAAAQALADVLGTQPIDPSSLLPDVSAEELAEATDEDTTEEGTAGDDATEPAVEAPAAPENPIDRTQWEAIAQRLDVTTLDALAGLGLDVGDPLTTTDKIDRVLAQVDELKATLTAKALELDEDRAIARREVRTARQELDVYAAKSTQSLSALQAEDRWERYRLGLDHLLGDVETDSVESVSAALHRVARFVEQLRGHLQAVRNGLGQLITYMSAESNVLTGKGEVRSERTQALESFELSRGQQQRVREWAERELAALVGSEALRNELFDAAANVSIDLRNATVTWESPTDGRIRRRPFEAFSSGEQVFAYTKAKLDRLGESPPAAQHVIVVLDEFGAFVARDRFGQLMDFVADIALGTVAEQIIVILPLADDYLLDANADDLVKAAENAQSSAHLKRIAQLAERQYFAVPAMPT